MLDSVDTRKLLLLRAATAAHTRKLTSARSLTALDRYLGDLPHIDNHDDKPGAARSASRTYGFGVDALVAQDALLATLDANDLEEIVDVVEVDIIQRWSQARNDVADELRDRLRYIHPKLAALYVGAWDQFVAQGPGHLESVCNLGAEVLSRILRTLAPDDDVRVGSRGRQAHRRGRSRRQGRPQGAASLHQAASQQDRAESPVIEVDVLGRATEALVARFNAGKHESVGDLAALRSNLVTLDSVLVRILD